MDDRHQKSDQSYGFPGLLSYDTRSSSTKSFGDLHSRRRTRACPRFSLLKPSIELCPPSKSPVPIASAQSRDDLRLQKRWLMNSCPEVIIDRGDVHNVLKDDHEHFIKSQSTHVDKPQLSVGYISNISDKLSVTSLPALAVIAGESGELVRIAKLPASEDHSTQDTNLKTRQQMDLAGEVMWQSDGLPISQVIFTNTSCNPDAPRWLIVQKSTSTAFLQPLFGTPSKSQQKRLGQQVLNPDSSIKTNLLFTISHSDTGGNAHCDVCIMKSHDLDSYQVLLLDECGYWTIWEVGSFNPARKDVIRPTLQTCGHVLQGSIEEIPWPSAYPTDIHGVVYLGSPTPDDTSDWNSVVSSSRSLQYDHEFLMFWDRQNLTFFDLCSGTSIFDISTQIGIQGQQILTARRSLAHPAHIIILTARFLVWVDASYVSADRRTFQSPKVLLKCPHDGLAGSVPKMSLFSKTDELSMTNIVLLHTLNGNQAVCYWLEASLASESHYWHRQPGIKLLPDSLSEQVSLESLHFLPLLLPEPSIGNSQHSGIPESRDYHAFQGFILREDLSVQSCLACSTPASSDSKFSSVSPPTLGLCRLGDTNPKNRTKSYQGLRDDAFIAPDDNDQFCDPEQFGWAGLASRKSALSIAAPSMPLSHPIQLDFSRFCSTMADNMARMGTPLRRTFCQQDFTAIQQALELSETRTLTTWQDITRDLQMPDSGNGISDRDVRSLLQGTYSHVTTVTLNKKQTPMTNLSPSELEHYFTNLWIDPLEHGAEDKAQQHRHAWISGLSHDIYLSTHGIIAHDTSLFTDAKRQANARGLKSDDDDQRSMSALDGAIRRLQLLAPSIVDNTMKAGSSSDVLLHWPSNRGIGTSGYISSVAKESDMKFEKARQRMRKLETRRKVQAEKQNRYTPTRPSFVDNVDDGLDMGGGRLSQPLLAHIKSSQPVLASSQTDGGGGPQIIMSQPVAGSFGQRQKLSKKPKKRSGFR